MTPQRLLTPAEIRDIADWMQQVSNVVLLPLLDKEQSRLNTIDALRAHADQLERNAERETAGVYSPTWRTGNKIKDAVYEGDRPVFPCRTPDEANRIVRLLNAGEAAMKFGLRNE